MLLDLSNFIVFSDVTILGLFALCFDPALLLYRLGLNHDLFLQELNNYLTVSTSTSVIVDKSSDGDFLRIDFNIRYFNFYCRFLFVASVFLDG